MPYNVGVYVRLSKEDGTNGNESTSVENQKALLSKFIMMMPGWIAQKTYVDDGWSGGSFNRPAFQEMIADAKRGFINLVLVKDLSRFGRNYIEAGEYLQNVLPDAGCRFVSISEGIDTAKGETDIMLFMNFVNDYYLRDLSKRIKTVLTAKAKNGEYLSGRPPYGYLRDPNNNHKLIVDEYAAEVVRRIFEMRSQKMGYGKIAGMLNSERILAPNEYWYQRQGKTNPTNCIICWRERTVKLLLAKEVYLGHTIAQTSGTLSHRSKKKIKKPESEWIRTENTHMPIIEQELWDAVQAVDLKASNLSEAKKTETTLFSGLLVCADCGAKMNAGCEKQTRKNTGKVVRYTSYACSYYTQTGRVMCSRHCIYEIGLKKIVSEQIQQHAENLSVNESEIIKKLYERLTNKNKDMLAEMKQTVKKLNRRIKELEAMSANLYEDKVAGTVSNEYFLTAMRNFEAEGLELQEQRNAIQSELTQTQNKMNDIQSWVSLIKSKMLSPDIDREFLLRIIDRIEIGERSVVVGIKYQDVKIFYKFVGEI